MQKLYILILLICSLGFTKVIKKWSPHLEPTHKQIAEGYYCEYGEFNGEPLYWQLLWWPRGDTPGVHVDSGDVNSWIPVNSRSFLDDTTYEWIGWNSNVPKYEIYFDNASQEMVEKEVGNWGEQIDTKGPGAYISTWRDGAEGAYTIHFDALGDWKYEKYVTPAIRQLNKYPWCKVAFSSQTEKMNDVEWAQARELVLKGHEVISGGFDGSPAESQWQRFFHGEELAPEDPSIPKQLRGLVVDSTLSGGVQLSFSKPRVTYKNGNVHQPETLHTLYSVQVSHDYKEDPNPDLEKDVYHNIGKIKAVHTGFNDSLGKNVTMLKLLCNKGWDDGSKLVNIGESKRLLDEQIYKHSEVKNIAPFLPQDFSTSFLTHKGGPLSRRLAASSLDTGYVGARGGVFRGQITPGDFYDPFSINYDRFVQFDETGSMIPGYQLHYFSYNGIVDAAVKSKGYMTRVFAGCETWDWTWESGYLTGWVITEDLFEKHLQYLNDQYEAHKLFVGTPTEVIRYRLTANAAKKALLTDSGDGYQLSIDMDNVPEKYQDEISVIVVLEDPLERCSSRYTDDSERAPRYQPRKMDEKGYAWSISFNPFIGDVLFGGMVGPHVVTMNKMQHNARIVSTGERLALQLAKGEYQLSLYAVSGKRVSQKAISMTQTGSHMISTTELAKGIYIAKVVGANGDELLSHKFIK